MNMSCLRSALKSLLPCCALLLVACGDGQQGAIAEEHAHVEDAGAEPARGPHGGRLLNDGDFSLEIAIFENGVPPEFRIYPALRQQPVNLQDVAVVVELRRVTGLPGGTVDRHEFSPRGDYLVSPTEVYEPHSFTASVVATHAGATHSWNYDSPEGRVDIADDVAAAQGIRTAIAGSGSISENLTLYGRVQPNAERVRAVGARFAGVVENVAVQVGDEVRAGQVLATVESNESLRSYPVTSPIAGTVVRRDTNAGQMAGGEPLFEIADFSTVWAELAVFPRDRQRVRSGQAVEIAAADGGESATGRIGLVSPMGAANQSLAARVVLDNRAGLWAPGQFVRADVTIARAATALSVPLSALQTFRDWDVVAVVEGERYQLQPVETGRRDATNVEILDGLAPGARIVVANSYLIKADVEKSGAAHDH